jgi:hypothetical protein
MIRNANECDDWRKTSKGMGERKKKSRGEKKRTLSTLSVLERLSSKGSLVDLALVRSGEGETEVLELVQSNS